MFRSILLYCTLCWISQGCLSANGIIAGANEVYLDKFKYNNGHLVDIINVRYSTGKHRGSRTNKCFKLWTTRRTPDIKICHRGVSATSIHSSIKQVYIIRDYVCNVFMTFVWEGIIMLLQGDAVFWIKLLIVHYNHRATDSTMTPWYYIICHWRLFIVGLSGAWLLATCVDIIRNVMNQF